MADAVSQHTFSHSLGKHIKSHLVGALKFILPELIFVTLFVAVVSDVSAPFKGEIIKNNSKPEVKIGVVSKPAPSMSVVLPIALSAKPVSKKKIKTPSFEQDALMPLPHVSAHEHVFSEQVSIEQTPAARVLNDPYVFPTLTEKEQKANEKEKRRMAKLIAKLSGNKGSYYYPYIKVPANGAFRGFYMGAGEVTNLEYRTFLFDLLINGKKEEFLIAKPEQNLWINANGTHQFDTLSRVYFSDKSYNENPVVNVSVAGAELYCAWLTEIGNELRQRDGKPPIRFRLPAEQEWLEAAQSGHSNAVYPWLTDSIQNRYNCFLANFCVQKLQDRFKQPIIYKGITTNPAAYTSAGFVLNKPGVSTVMVWSYNPNDYRLYGICGNAAEMVYCADGIKARGGSWNSDFEHLKLNNHDEPAGKLRPSPMTGFRVCGELQRQ